MKNTKTKISIITTYYNDEKYILFALESVHAQLLTEDYEIEYIIVNDCSTDKSEELVNKFIEVRKLTNTGITYKHVKTKKNLGCGGARKFGISKATGKYFMFLDADDYYLNRDFVFKAMTAITQDDADIVEFGIKYNEVDGSYRMICASEKIKIEDPISALRVMFGNGAIRFNVWSKIYKKSIVKSHPYSDERTYEDVRTIPYWIQNAKRIVIIPSVEINYRATDKSIIRTNSVETRLGTIKAFTELMDTMPKEVHWDIYNRAMFDLTAILDGHNSKDPGFNEMSRYNTIMLSKLLPESYKEFTYNIEDDETIKK